MPRFVDRVRALPRMFVGLSTEHGASAEGFDPIAFRHAHPEHAVFLEIGADVHRGFDATATQWIENGWSTTYHFLDLNLEEPEDLDDAWFSGTMALARQARAAWLCGDAGMWHIGPRDRGHGTLLPPILCADSVAWMAESVMALRERSSMEVLPENPPAHVLVGDLHILEYFGALAERADCGLLLDVSHLAIVQHALGLRPTTLLDMFPVERVVEIHVAGGAMFRAGKHLLVDDTHGPHVLDETWAILEAVIPRAHALRGVVVECERNPIEAVLPLFAAVQKAVQTAPGWVTGPVDPPGVVVPAANGLVDHRTVQRTLFRMLLDANFAEEVRNDGTDEVAPPAADWLAQIDLELLAADAGGRRKDQLLGNVALEYVHTIRSAPNPAAFLEGFLASAQFHRAIATDGSLPVAFGVYAAEVLAEGPGRAFLELDRAMAEVRRAIGGAAVDAGSVLTWSTAFRLLVLPEGTVAAAGQPTSPHGTPTGLGRESVAVWATGPPGPDRHVSVEVITGAVAELVTRCPLSEGDLLQFAQRHEASDDEIRGLIEQLITDGMLERVA